MYTKMDNFVSIQSGRVHFNCRWLVETQGRGSPPATASKCIRQFEMHPFGQNILK